MIGQKNIRKLPPPPPGHVIQLTGTIFKLNSHIKETNFLTKFHENWAKKVTSRVFTCFHYIHIVHIVHVIELTGTIFELNSHIKETNVLTKFHESWAKNVTSRAEKCPAHWQPYVNKTNVLTNFHDDWAKIVTSRVLTSHVIELTRTIFKLNSHIKETNVLTKFHENWAKNVTSRVFTCFHYIHIENKRAMMALNRSPD
ncbi:hypothetical protein DPMN_168202 [Dreissena polymorpha]|uniref:Uncharacterized protein n=1 Tax=Dreissena polymorpha TaxID=45954 RepID=A0A9D4IZF6_DREPO|nr:hypothetical protein DPMN_168202 [Dreissena polymorpha]